MMRTMYQKKTLTSLITTQSPLELTIKMIKSLRRNYRTEKDQGEGFVDKTVKKA